MEQTGDTTGTMEQNQPVELKKLTPLGELLGQALRRTVKLFPKAVAVSIIIGICIFTSIIIGIGFAFLLKSTVMGLTVSIILSACTFGLFAGYAGIWLYTSVIVLICNSDSEVKIKEILKTGWKLTMPYLVVSTWVGLLIAGGFIFLIVPGIIYLIWFLSAPFILVCENIRGRLALVRSKNLIKGYWWPVFGRLFVIVILGTVISMLIGLMQGKPPSLNIFWFIVYILFTIFLQFFMPVCIYLIYKNLYEIKGPASAEELNGFPKNWSGWLISIIGVIIFIAYICIISMGIIKSPLAKKNLRPAAAYHGAGSNLFKGEFL